MPNDTQNLPAVNFFTPVELINLYRNYLLRRGENNVIWMRGIYMQRPQQGPWSAYFDDLRDVKSQITVTLKVDRNFERPQSNSLVQVAGIVETNTFTNGTVQILLLVTRFNVVKDQFITEAELKRAALLQKKRATPAKNVTAEIGQVLLEGRRPSIALVIAANTKTQGDFEDGLRNARSAIDFVEHRVTFTHTTELCDTLKALDTRGFTAIAIYRGGGIDSNTDVDKPEVLEVVVNMRTPFISGVGHQPEQIFLRQVADAWTATPQGLGQFFSDIVEDIAAKRNNSRAVLVQQIEKQFKDQIEKQQKQNTELQKKLTDITKANETAQKNHAEQLGKLQVQMKSLSVQNANQSKEFNETLKNMQETSRRQQTALEKLTAQNTQSAKDLNEAKEHARQLEKQLEEALSKNKGCYSGCLGLVATIISITSFACWMVCLLL